MHNFTLIYIELICILFGNCNRENNWSTDVILVLPSHLITINLVYVLMPGFQVNHTEWIQSRSKLASCINKQAFICCSLHGHASKPRYSAGAAWEGCFCSSKKTFLYAWQFLFSSLAHFLIDFVFIFRELHVELSERQLRLSLLQLLVNRRFVK